MVSETTNQLIVSGSAADVEHITSLIEELDSQITTTVIPLKRLKASAILAQITHLASRPENITVDAQGNSLIIRDNSEKVEQIRKVVSDLDETLVTKVITLRFALASDVQNVLGPMVSNPEAFQADTRTNQIVICDSTSQVTRMEEIIAKLDKEDSYFTRTFHLQHAPASDVAGIVETFLSSQRPQQTISAADRGYARPPVRSETAAPASGPSTPAPAPGSRDAASSQTAGTGPGLSGIRATPREGAPATTTAPAGPQVSQSAGSNSNSVEAASNSLGTAGTVVADDRSNTVTVTETLALLTKIEQLMRDLDVPVKAYSYTAQYRLLDTASLDKMIPNFLRSEGDSYFVDEQSRSIHFTTIPSMAERLVSVLKEWDRPAKQVLIRAKILSVGAATLKDVGVNIEAVFEAGDATVTARSAFPSQVTEDRAGSLTLQKLTGTQFDVVIRAIEADNHSRVLANPRIMAMDNTAAQVRTATDEPFTETSIDATSGSTIQNVRFLQVGTVLDVTPHIRENRTIEMEIGLDVSSLTDIRNGVPVVKRNIASSSVTVKDNHVLMIGGLRFNRDMNVREGVPILRDLPLVGLIFQSNRTEWEDTELVLFLQPTIVDSSEGTEKPADPNEVQDYSEDFANGQK